MTRHFGFCALTAIIAMLTATSALADQQIKFEIKTVTHNHSAKFTGTVPDKPEPEIDEVQTDKTSATLTLGPTYLVIDTPDHQSIFNFDTKHVIEINRKNREYMDIDLHSLACFKVLEYQNRLMLSDLLSRSGLKKAAASTFELQSLFGVQLPGEKSPQVIIKHDGNTTRYLHEGTEIAATALSSNTIEPALIKTFQRFLAQEMRLHPEIRRQIAEQKNVPSTLSYNYADTPRQESAVTYTLSSVQKVPSAETSPPADYKQRITPDLGAVFSTLDTPQGITRTTPPDSQTTEAKAKFAESITGTPDLEPISNALKALGANPHFPTMDSVTAEARQAAKSGNKLDAMLMLFEYPLETGDHSVTGMQELGPELISDPRVQIFSNNVAPQSEADIAPAIKALNALDRHALSRGYIIDFMLGNIYASNNEPVKAEQSLIFALTRNPLLIGAYKDLGMILIQQFDTSSTWQCFDIAKKLQPHHPQLTEVFEMEKKLENDFPELF